MSYSINTNSEALKALQAWTAPHDFYFGRHKVPVMITAHYQNNQWSNLNVQPYGSLNLPPSCKAFHYGQEIFEGLKAFKTSQGVHLFRPQDNARRFMHSARLLDMPEVSEDMFLTSVTEITKLSAPFIPTQTDHFLYIRPFMFANEDALRLMPSKEYLFVVIASPSGNTFNTPQVPVMIERNRHRCAPGSCGTAKAAGNYAASLASMKEAQALGYDQVLFLDAKENRYIEELSAMNFFAIYSENGKKQLHTPALTDTILAGVTRDTILKMATTWGYEPIERRIDVNEFLKDIESGKVVDAFACGTASIITPLTTLGDSSGKKWNLPEQKFSAQLKQKLLDLQERRSVDLHDWIVSVV